MADAFRRATSEIQKKHKKVPTSDPSVFLNFLIREVYYDEEKVQRNIVIEKVVDVKPIWFLRTFGEKKRSRIFIIILFF